MIKKLKGRGLCACGCGQSTFIPKYSRVDRGWVKGRAIRYIHGHNGLQIKKQKLGIFGLSHKRTQANGRTGGLIGGLTQGRRNVESGHIFRIHRIASHRRYHVSRHIKNPKCKLCKKHAA